MEPYLANFFEVGTTAVNNAAVSYYRIPFYILSKQIEHFINITPPRVPDESTAASLATVAMT
jgi:hypothetical protein